MEYLFKLNRRDGMTTIRLADYSMVVKRDDKSETISYANIISVRICKSAENDFCINISIEGHAPLKIQSWSYSENGDKVNQSTGYSLFVRVLHHHLLEKSKAVYHAGSKSEKAWWWIAASVIFSLIISVSADYLGFNFMNLYVQALILSVLFVMTLFVLGVSRLPKSYHPGNIPLQFLP